jgi:hypothetical protein
MRNDAFIAKGVVSITMKRNQMLTSVEKKQSRLDKAKALVGNVRRNEDCSYSVQSQSNPSKVYTVRLQLGAGGRTQGYTCTCPDFEHRGQVEDGPAEAKCKHIMAVERFNGDYEIKQMIKQMSRGAL